MHQLEKWKIALENVVIIIPTYNEATCIGSTLDELRSVCSAITTYRVKILVFDSNSTDNTVAIVKTKQTNWSDLYLHTEQAKTGLGSAYIQAMQYAIKQLNADIVFEFDGDGSHQPKYIPDMLKLFSEGADVVVGSRYVAQGSIPADWQINRKFFSLIGNYVARAILTRKYKDFTSGFRGTRTYLLKQIKLDKLLSKNYAYKLHLFWALHRLRANIVEFPIEFIDRKQGYSKFPKNNIFESLKVILILRLLASKRYLSICLVGSIGVALQLLCYNLLRHCIVPEYANIISIELAIIVNFLINNRISFADRKLKKQDKKIKWLYKFVQCNFFSLGSMFIQTLILMLGIDIFGNKAITENLIVIFGIFVGSIYNYVIYSRVIWKKDIEIQPSESMHS